MIEIIAEIGVNHQNDLATAKELIKAAQGAGATAVKFQASTVDEEVSRKIEPVHYDFLKGLVPTFDFLQECAGYAKEIGIEFLCTPAGQESLGWVIRLGCKRIKIGSDNLTNLPLLQAVEDTDLPMILSTGMASMDVVTEIVTGLDTWGYKTPLTILHCGSAYPLPTNEANLLVIPSYIKRFPYHRIGWSDHTVTTFLPAVAVAMGATVIEKHITLNSEAVGPDHGASLEPWLFDDMVREIRLVEEALGSGQKYTTKSEQITAKTYGKSIVATRDIKKGEALDTSNIAIKRPGGGPDPRTYYAALNKRATKDIAEGDFIW